VNNPLGNPTVYNRIKNPKFDWKAGSFKNG
jgi:hypothetical protein